MKAIPSSPSRPRCHQLPPEWLPNLGRSIRAPANVIQAQKRLIANTAGVSAPHAAVPQLLRVLHVRAAAFGRLPLIHDP